MIGDDTTASTGYTMQVFILLTLFGLIFGSPHQLRLSDDEVADYFGLSTDHKPIVPDHQIVYIEQITPEKTRHITRDNIAEKSPSFKFRAFDEEFHLDVTKDNDLFVEQTTSCTYVDDTGTETIERIPNDCFYKGRLRGNPNSIVSINTCAGMTGSITREGHGDVFIEPLKHAHASKRGMKTGLGHVVYKAPKNHQWECGIKDDVNVTGYDFHADATKRVYAEKYLKLRMVADHQYYALRQTESCTCLTAMFHALAHRMALLPQLNVLLDGITIETTNTNLDTDSVSAGGNLEKTRTWMGEQPNNEQWDHVALIVPYYMDVGGVAWLCGTCGGNRVSVSSVGALYAVQIIAHEMGHNICIGHDNGSAGCGRYGFIMGAAGWASEEMGWTQCSLDTYNQKIDTFNCLSDN